MIAILQLCYPLTQPTEPNQRVHADHFGPLKTIDCGKKFIWCMTDALTKYVKLVPLPNKEANTVADTIFSKWFCRFGMPLDLITDQGKEFCTKLSDDLFKRLGTNHLTILNATARLKWLTKPSLNTWLALAMTAHWTGNSTWCH
jgi:hypothetical protein